MSANPKSQHFIGLFASHPVAANLLMLIMILAGGWGLFHLNTQFLPNFDVDFITISTIWRGASAEDMERSVTAPIEQGLRSLNSVHEMTSTSSNGITSITLEYEEDANMGLALDQVNEQISLLRNLPTTSERPEVTRIITYESIARLLISGSENINRLRHYAYDFEQQLLARGISKVLFIGLPQDEIIVQVPAARLNELGMTLSDIAQKIKQFSQDFPAGTIARDEAARQLRSLEQRRSELAFLDIPLQSTTHQNLTLADIATIKRRPKTGQTELYYQGKPAVELVLQRASNNDALKSARVMQDWLAEIKPKLPPNINIHVYSQSWRLIKGRINILLKNGLGGLALVVLILYLFLNGRVAFWVAVGIPVSLLATQSILYYFNGSINMVSLFAMIMALGIIVDDAIVVGEDALAHYQQGENALQAAQGGALRMLAPVAASSLTTIATFIPLMLIGGIMGKILFDIPLVVICVIIASLIESFFILPGHLFHSFKRIAHDHQPHAIRKKLDAYFYTFRDQYFRPAITTVIQHRWSTVSATFTILLLTIGLLINGRINFNFFPTPEGTILNANVSFNLSIPAPQIKQFVNHLNQTLQQTEKELGGNLVTTVLSRYYISSAAGGNVVQRGEQFASMVIELTAPDARTIRNQTFINHWKKNIQFPAGIANFTISERRSGPPGRDIDIRLYGTQADSVKQAALQLNDVLKGIKGVSAIEDDMPYGREQLVYRLTDEAISAGLTTSLLGQQLRAAFDGELAQILLDQRDEIEIRVMLPDEERNHLAILESLQVQLPNGTQMPLLSAITLSTQRGYAALRHSQGKLATLVSANVDTTINNSHNILQQLQQEFLPKLEQDYGVTYSLEGRAADQAETLADMKRGVILALVLMYLILAWVFASYGWPLVVMIAIPFGLVGALVGHLILGIDLTLLSLFGFFGLSGIVVNDAIILVTFYRHQRESGQNIDHALVEAACQRLRAVMLTSLTTVGGLLPLLFETSLEAQFLIPMAVSICFGLIFSTLLVLLVIPALLAIYEHAFATKVVNHS